MAKPAEPFFYWASLLLFVVALVPFIKLIPVAALSAILIAVGFRRATSKEFRYRVGPEQLIVFVIAIIIALTLRPNLLFSRKKGVA